MSVWKTQGFDAASIEANSKQSNIINHAVLGVCYRAPILNKGTREAHGWKRGSGFGSRGSYKKRDLLTITGADFDGQAGGGGGGEEPAAGAATGDPADEDSSSSSSDSSSSGGKQKKGKKKNTKHRKINKRKQRPRRPSRPRRATRRQRLLSKRLRNC